MATFPEKCPISSSNHFSVNEILSLTDFVTISKLKLTFFSCNVCYPISHIDKDIDIYFAQDPTFRLFTCARLFKKNGCGLCEHM